MTSRTTFPDAIVFPDGTIRLVTDAAKQWAYANTAMNGWCEINTVPDYVDFDDSIPPLMEGKGFALRRERVPVSHYRSKRIRWPKSTLSDNAKVIDYLQRIPKQYRDDARRRFHARQRERNHRRQEAAKRMKEEHP